MNSTRQRVGAIVLAAGGSSRLGSPKQLIPHDGQPLVRRAASAVLASGASPLIVVLGADAERIAEALQGLDDLTTVTNENWASGLASSLAKGIGELMTIPECDGAMITLADQSRIDAPALGRLLSAFDKAHRLVAAAYAGTIGVPAVFGREFFDDLMQLTGDSGAGKWLRARSDRVTAIPLPEAETDIDTASDVPTTKQ